MVLLFEHMYDCERMDWVIQWTRDRCVIFCLLGSFCSVISLTLLGCVYSLFLIELYVVSVCTYVK